MSNGIQFILCNLSEKEINYRYSSGMKPFGVDMTVVSKHLKNVFESSELLQDSVCANFAHTAEDDKIYMCLTSFDRNVSLHITI